MRNLQKGVSLIALIITIAIIVIIAGVTIQTGLQRTDDAKFAKHNTNISTTQEEVEAYYYSNGGELPVVNYAQYTIPSGSTLDAETTKNGDNTDEFYVVDLRKLGKVSGNLDETYIVSKTKHNVYSVNGTTIKGLVYHGRAIKSSGTVAQGGGSTPTAGATSTPTTAPSYAYNNPKIPNGFTKVGSETWDTGFTIQDSNGNQFVWVPVANLPADGTLDGTNFNSKFGRRNFRGNTFGESNYYETNDTNLQNMTTSVNTYGGFYIARYEMSSSDGTATGKARSKADVTPWTDIDWNNSKAKSESMDTDWGWDTNSVESYLCYGAHWDTALQWLMTDTGSGNHRTLAQIKADSTTWGNYYDETFAYGAGLTKVKNSSVKINTGASTTPPNRHMAKGIYDLAGNVWEWTMESNASSFRICRGGNYNIEGSIYPAAYRGSFYPTDTYAYIGFRTTLYLK